MARGKVRMEKSVFKGSKAKGKERVKCRNGKKEGKK